MAEQAPGSDDGAVLSRAAASEALLLTADKDFGEIVFRQGRASCGVLLLRLSGLPNARKAELVAGAVARFGDELRGAFTVVTPGAIRRRERPLP